MTRPVFTPYPGYAPFDGLDTRISLSRDNPVHRADHGCASCRKANCEHTDAEWLGQGRC